MTTVTPKTPQTDPATIAEHEAQQVERANATGLQPVVFIHGLWLLPSSWDRWATVFEEAGYTTLTPGWPDDPRTVAEANANPEVLAHKTVGPVADHHRNEGVTGMIEMPNRGHALAIDSGWREVADTAHARESGHPVIASAEPGERWLYCYPDEAFAEY